MCPLTSIVDVEGSRYSPSSIRDWQPPRRKSVSNACERCRRRKIRCDGDTPCSTCSRFNLPCIRHQKPREQVASEHQQALESRIHQLEAQLAAHVNSPMHGMDSIDQSLMGEAPNFDWAQGPPNLTVETNLRSNYGAENIDMSAFSTTSSVPSIAITACEPKPSITSPESPVPSFWSGTTRASSPTHDMHPTSAPQYTASLAPPISESTYSPPFLPHGVPSWEFVTQGSLKHLKPESNHSRRTSVTSLSLEDDEMADIAAFPEFDAGPPRLPRQGIFASHIDSPAAGQPTSTFSNISRALSSDPLPSKFEGETLTSIFLAHVASLQPNPYGITPSRFRHFFDVVYPDPHHGPTYNSSVSVGMIRFHVFLAMAVGMKIKLQGAMESNALLDRCYQLAMQQTSAPSFWLETGGIEATQLLGVLASLRKEPSNNADPKPLQQTWSW